MWEDIGHGVETENIREITDICGWMGKVRE